MTWPEIQLTIPRSPAWAPAKGLEASPSPIFEGDRADGKAFVVELQKLAEQAQELASI